MNNTNDLHQNILIVSEFIPTSSYKSEVFPKKSKIFYISAGFARIASVHFSVLLIQKYFPKELPYLAPVVSPMQAHCKDIKRRNPKAKTVFIGPCVAKKDEAQREEGVVDAVLTFDELTAWLKA